MNREDLKNAVLNAKLNGKKNKEIEIEALQSGWSEEEISYAFKNTKPSFIELMKILLLSTIAALIPIGAVYLLEVFNHEISFKIINLDYFHPVLSFLTFILIFIFNFIYALKNKAPFMKMSFRGMVLISIYFVLFFTFIQMASLLFQPNVPYESLSYAETRAFGQALFIIFFPFAALQNIYLATLLFINLLLIKSLSK